MSKLRPELGLTQSNILVLPSVKRNICARFGHSESFSHDTITSHNNNTSFILIDSKLDFISFLVLTSIDQINMAGKPETVFPS